MSTISSALNWTLQRLSSHSPPPSTSASTSASTSTSTSASASTTPTPRSTPPPLLPIALTGYLPSTRTRLMTPELAEEIRLLLPARLQLPETWSLRYSLEQHGVSLTTLYKNCLRNVGAPVGHVLVVKDSLDSLFGAFLNEPPTPTPHYTGNGECFLWKSTAIGTTTAATASFRAFAYSGVNEYCILADSNYVAIGGGNGRYGLWLDCSFEKGLSQACDTFGNEALSEEGEKFEVIGVEVWSIR